MRRVEQPQPVAGRAHPEVRRVAAVDQHVRADGRVVRGSLRTHPGHRAVVADHPCPAGERVGERVVAAERPVGDHQRHVAAPGGQSQLRLRRVLHHEHPLEAAPVVAGGPVHPVVVVEEERARLRQAAVRQRVVVGAGPPGPHQLGGRLPVVLGRVVVAVQVHGHRAGPSRQPVHEPHPGLAAGPAHDGRARVAAAVRPHPGLRPRGEHPHLCLAHRQRDLGAAHPVRDDERLVERRQLRSHRAVTPLDDEDAAHLRVQLAEERVGALPERLDPGDRGAGPGGDADVEERHALRVGGHRRDRVVERVQVDQGEGAPAGQRDLPGREADLPTVDDHGGRCRGDRRLRGRRGRRRGAQGATGCQGQSEEPAAQPVRRRPVRVPIRPVNARPHTSVIPSLGEICAPSSTLRADREHRGRPHHPTSTSTFRSTRSRSCVCSGQRAPGWPSSARPPSWRHHSWCPRPRPSVPRPPPSSPSPSRSPSRRSPSRASRVSTPVASRSRSRAAEPPRSSSSTAATRTGSSRRT